MPLDVSRFIAVIDRGSFAPAANYEVLVFPPSTIGENTTDGNQLMFRCTSVLWPGRALETSPFTPYGLPRKFVVNQQLGRVYCTFLCSEDLREKTFFQRWQDLAVGPSRRANGYQAGMFDIGFYDNYAGSLEIWQYGVKGERTFYCQLLECYPVEVGQLSGNWQSTEFHMLGITFEYYIYRDDPQPLSAASST